jgi:hypothetical protein
MAGGWRCPVPGTALGGAEMRSPNAMSVGSLATLPGSAETAGVGVAGAGHDPLEATGAGK